MPQSLEHLPLRHLGATPAQERCLSTLGLDSVWKLLLHLPVRYLDQTVITSLDQLQLGQQITVEGPLLAVGHYGRRLTLTLQGLSLHFFSGSARLRAQAVTGAWVRACGRVQRDSSSGLMMAHPRLQLAYTRAQLPALTTRLTPIYPATAGLTSEMIARLIRRALRLLLQHPLQAWPLCDLFDPLPSLVEAFTSLHAPQPDEAADLSAWRHPAQHRLCVEELLVDQLRVVRAYDRYRARRAIPLPPQGDATFWSNLPFTPTAGQRRAIEEIRARLSQSQPMLHLLQGEVGSGKTLVAVAAALPALLAQKQVIMMAPTELLARQHHAQCLLWMAPLGVEVHLVVSGAPFLNPAPQGALLLGTHALMHAPLTLPALALVIIDEQHRFGVAQRASFCSGACVPHLLMMSATPIPRTLQLVQSGTLTCSTLVGPPVTRGRLQTIIVSAKQITRLIERLQAHVLTGRQLFWVCPRIVERPQDQVQDVMRRAVALEAALPTVKIALLHGKMRRVEKHQVMQRFLKNDLQLLVCTTLVEVGLDVPNATVMVIEHPDRLGLAQLHQLRGRVGRGAEDACCVLLYHPPLSPLGAQRLKIVQRCTQGDRLAYYDLQLRGPGESLGRAQSGTPFWIADVHRDRALTPQVAALAKRCQTVAGSTLNAVMVRWKR